MSDNVRLVATTDSSPVMASSDTQNVVNSSQSVADSSVADVHALQPFTVPATSGAVQPVQEAEPNVQPSAVEHPEPEQSAPQIREHLANGLASQIGLSAVDDQGVDDQSVDDQGLDGQGIDGQGVEDSIGVDFNLDHGAGSDTDISRADSTEQGKDGLSKSLAVKKFSSFKAVSVTKTFLAKAATLPPTVKVGDKGAPGSTAQPIALKPRLVAKLGSGLRDVPRVRASPDSPADGSTVWNKNRPVPPQPPKQFTDEELKQQYGIHLATRLQSDEGIKGSMWADMDEDEDDWAPEAVEWIDGTKSTLAPSVDTQPAPPEPMQILKKEEGRNVKEDEQEELPQEQPRPPLIPLARTNPTGPPKTILRPGVALQAKQGAMTSGTLEQKPSLVAKSPAAAPAKSPWASLPPVDRISPIVINPPQSTQPPSRFGYSDQHGFDNMPPPSVAREMPADTFDRSWRESERGSRELFNSQSGRYEPAPELRKGSNRADHSSRQPAVLQRPLHNSAMSPAEPSSAFQTRSAGPADESPWGRRRMSSVSGSSSIPRERRMSIAQSSTVLSPQEEAPMPVFIGSQTTSQVSETEVRDQTALAPQQAHAPQQQAPDMAEEIARQKKLMQEKREAAIRRRKEEEEREEVARKERIRIKMESLGMAPLAAKTSASEQASDKQVEQPEHVAVPVASVLDTITPAAPAEAPTQVKLPLDAQAATSRQAVPSPKVTKLDLGPQTAPQPQATLSPLPSTITEAPQVTSQDSRNVQGSSAQGAQQPSSYSSPAQTASWKSPNLDQNAFSTWGPGNMTSHSSPGGNVWGPPTARHQAIGNGTFGLAHRQQQQSGGFGSIVPFGQQTSRIASRNFMDTEQPSPSAPQPASEHQQPPATITDARSSELLGSSLLNGVSPTPIPARPHQPGPIAPPQRAVSRPQPPATQRGTSAWGQFAAQAQEAQVENERKPPQPKTVAPSGVSQQRWKETYKQTGVQEGWLGGVREVLHKETTVHGGPPISAIPPVANAAPPVAQSQDIVSPQPSVAQPWQRMGAESTVRLPSGPSSFAADQQRATPSKPLAPQPPMATSQQSRFFPSASYSGSPPPEESSHPVFDGDARLPHVRLPSAKPTVKLPPASPTAPGRASPVNMPQRTPSFRAGTMGMPLVASSDWQARFNGLFGRVQTTTATPPSPPGTPPKMQTPALAVASLSKAVMEHAVVEQLATVSLPLAMSQPRITVVEEPVSKPTVDDIFNDELSFGSIPKVFLPRGVRYAEAFTGSHSMPSAREHSKHQRPVDVQTKQEAPLYMDYRKGPGVLTISMPLSTRPAKDVPYQHKRPKTGPKDRKVSTKLKRGAATEAKENTPSPAASMPASPLPKNIGKDSRQTSSQKGSAAAPNSSIPSSKASPTPDGAADNGFVSPAAKSRDTWAKSKRGRKPPTKVGV